MSVKEPNMPIRVYKSWEDLKPDLALAFLAVDSAAGLPKANPIQSTQTSGKQGLSLMFHVTWGLPVPRVLKSPAERPSAEICA